MQVERCCLDCRYFPLIEQDGHSGVCDWSWQGKISSSLRDYIFKRQMSVFPTEGSVPRISITKPHVNCAVWEENLCK